MASTDCRPIPLKNVAYRAMFPILDADGDLVSGASSPDSEVSKDQGTFTDCTNEATEIATSSGMYYLDLTSTEMNADGVAVIIKTGTAGAKTTPLVLYPEETGDINVDVTAYGGSAGTFSGGRPEVNASHAAGTAWNSGAIGAATLASDTIAASKIAADAITSAKIADGALTAAKIADGAIDAATFAAGAIDAAAIASNAIAAAKIATGAITSAKFAAGAIDAAAIADGAIDAATFAAGAIDAAAIADNAIDAGAIASNAITVAKIADDAITASKIAANAIGASELAADAVTEIQSGLSTLDAAGVRTAVGLATANLDTQLSAIAGFIDQEVAQVLAASVTRTGTAQAGAAGTITLDAGANANNDFYNNQIIVIASGAGAGQARVISDYVGATKVATVNGSWVTNPDNTSVFYVLPFGSIPGATAPTAAEVADAVWEEAIADHSGTSGSTAEALNAAGAAGDPWTTALPGAYGSGSAGNILGNNLNATVSSRAPESGGNLAAVKAKTDSLTFTAANKVDATIQAAGDFAQGAADKAWATAARTLTAGTNIVLAKGTGVTGFNDLSAAQVNAEADTALADVGLTSTVTGRVDAAISTRATPAQVNAEVDTALADYDGPTHAELTSELAAADDAVLAAIAALNNLSAAGVLTQVNAALDTQLSATIPADGTRPTLRQGVYMNTQFLYERTVSGTTLTVKNPDGSTLATLTLGDATSPTSVTRAT